MVWNHPSWLDDYFCLTPYQKLMWFAAQGRWHGIARADLFFCTDGRVQCCEVNSDTPSGEAEAVILNRLLATYHGAVHDPNRRLPGAFWRMLVASHGARQPRTVGIIYPTELTDDLSMIALYREWLEARMCQAELLAHRQDWVLKSAYGCEGEETICGPFVSDETWGEAVTQALPPWWVCQRFFHAAPESQGALCNYGVFLVGGRGVGFFT